MFERLEQPAAEAAAVKSLGDLPLIVLTAKLNDNPGWPEWQPEQHNNLDALVIADPKLPIPPDPPARVLHWTSGWRTLG